MPDISKRIQLLQQRIATSGLDALLVSNPVDIRYLTGFVGDDSWALVRTRSKTVHLISDFRFNEQIARQAPQAKTVMRKTSLTAELGTLVKRLKIKQLGLQENHLTIRQRNALVKQIGAKQLKAIDDGLLNQRAVKDASEARIIRKAVAIAQQAYNKTLAWVELGQTEYQIAAYLEYQMRILGADGPSFSSIVAVDANASLPHAVPGSKKVRKGCLILFDWGARYQGYCSDLTRVVAVGKMKPKMRTIYQIVLDAQLAAMDAIKPGIALSEIDAVARNLISKAGYGKEFGHSLGHGIGLNIHENPTLATRSQGVLEPGNIVTIEPGIYLPGQGGVRIEDDVQVTDQGGKVLSDLPKSLESAII